MVAEFTTLQRGELDNHSSGHPEARVRVPTKPAGFESPTL